MTPKISDPIWFFDENRRVYAPGEHGRPIWREHWVKRCIVGETRVNWIVSHEPGGRPWVKVPKKLDDARRRHWAFSEAEIDDLEWIEDNAWRLAERVRDCKDAGRLRQVASILGWIPESKPARGRK